jgi:hypothetical protein
VPASSIFISELERQVDLLPVPGVVEAPAPAVRSSRPAAHMIDARRRHRLRHHVLPRSSERRRLQRRRRPAELPAGAGVLHHSRARRRRGDVPAALGEGALELVRVLVAAQRLRAVELAVAVVAGERLPGGGGGTTAGGEVQAQVEADARGVRGRLVLHRGGGRKKAGSMWFETAGYIKTSATAALLSAGPPVGSHPSLCTNEQCLPSPSCTTSVPS